ncbi:hypothetical protein PR08_gp38 [Idiomarinaceae phage Phi1M2-2]|uniref:hypothetical protein n=1 Tax=Idiomarinaceae phage Phi1M2-2 TaxID=1527515 RepID=UPI0004F6583E|nr:hypothetical protein PR08_gp38 [Idiomarinaceae phage Phi1M2-2]AIM40795.1 hypothetical protein M22_038 [Idiomarinaceae phage Phi1M2-2]
MITQIMATELSRIARGEPTKSRTARGALTRRGFARRTKDGFTLTDDGALLLNFWNRK